MPAMIQAHGNVDSANRPVKLQVVFLF